MQVNKILVPIIGDEADEEAIRLACKLGKQHKSQIYAVYVIIMQLTFPLAAEVKTETEKAEKVLEGIRNLVEAQSLTVQGIIIQTREAGEPIITVAKEYGIDLIIIGIKRMTRFGQFSLGSTVPYILKNAPCRVILYRQYTPQ